MRTLSLPERYEIWLYESPAFRRGAVVIVAIVALILAAIITDVAMSAIGLGFYVHHGIVAGLAQYPVAFVVYLMSLGASYVAATAPIRLIAGGRSPEKRG